MYAIAVCLIPMEKLSLRNGGTFSSSSGTDLDFETVTQAKNHMDEYFPIGTYYEVFEPFGKSVYKGRVKCAYTSSQLQMKR